MKQTECRIPEQEQSIKCSRSFLKSFIYDALKAKFRGATQGDLILGQEEEQASNVFPFLLSTVDCQSSKSEFNHTRAFKMV